MGNKLARTTQVSASEYYLHDLPSSCNLVLKEVLGGGRILKSVQCLHDEGLLLVKVYFKRGEFPDLKEEERKLYRIREELMKIEHSHVWPFQYWLETDKAAYLLRQYFFSNLHDRISTRPFLSMIEKKWLAFQLLLALKQCHERGICHGDIKCENVLVTSWNWLYLADFASFKPTYLPSDNPADFSFFFDTGGRRRCYLAPERFCEPVGDTHIVTDASLKPAMDIFSLGCVIAELFSEGQALFDYSQLLAYRKGQYDPCPFLQKVSDPGIREMILHMIQLEPESRLSAEHYMQQWTPLIFPPYFSPLLHGFFSCLLPLDIDTRVAVTSSAFCEIRKQMIVSQHTEEELDNQGTSDMVAKASKEEQHGLSSVPQAAENSDLQYSIAGEIGSNTQCSLSQSLPNVPCQELIDDLNALLRDGESSASQLVSTVASNVISQPAKVSKKVRSKKDCTMANAPKLISDTIGAKGNRRCVPAPREHDDLDKLSFTNNFLDVKGMGLDVFNRSMRRFKASAIAIADAGSLGSNLDSEGTSSRGLEVFENFKHENIRDTESNKSTRGINCEGMVLIASLLCASLRNIKLPQARREAIQLLHGSSLYIDDDARLQHVLPYVAALLSDSAAIVRCAALETVCDVLSLVQSFPPSDSKIFPEYILPLLSMLPDDPEESVRICYVKNIHKIALTACRFLVGSQYYAEPGILDRIAYSVKGPTMKASVIPNLQQNTGKFDTELIQLRESIAHIIQELVMGQKQTPSIRRGLLQHVDKLCRFFGQKQCNDFLLPILPAFLNDRDVQLRAVFFEHIVHVCLFVGQCSVEAYLLPYIEQALSDVEETVIVNALECLAALSVHNLLRKRILLGAVEHAAPLLCHPSQWVRRSAVTFVSSTSANLDMADSHAFLSPILTPFLRHEPVSLCSEVALLTCLKPPMSREVFNRVLSDVMLSQTASNAINEKEVNKSRQKSSPVQVFEQSQNKYSLERRGKDKDGRLVAPLSGTRTKTSPARWASYLDASLLTDGKNLNATELDDGEKMKAMEGYIRSLSSTMQSRMHNWEMENSEKLQNSVIGMAAGVGTGFFSNYDGSSEGIPLYSVPLHERKTDNQGVSLFDEESSWIAGVRQGVQPFNMAALSAPTSTSSNSSHWLAGHMSMPTGDGMQRSRMVASFSPKLMSGSFYGGSLIGARRVYEVIRDASSREGEPLLTSSGISQPVTASRSKEPFVLESGMHGLVSAVGPGMTGMVLSEPAPMLSYSGGTMVDGQCRPRGVLIAHMQEHQRAVNQIAVSHDNCFFVSASDDGNVKIWDCRRLESNISFRSRLTYTLQTGRALCVCMVGTGAQVAAGSSNGILHVFSVDYVTKVAGNVERYSGISDVRKLETQEGAVLSLRNYSLDGPQMFLYTTQRNGIHLWDLRCQINAWSLKANPVHGYICATALDCCKNWLVTATSRGVVMLWDIRFQIPVNSWQHPLSYPVESMQLPVSNPDPTTVSSLRPFVYIAAGKDELALWNAEDGTCHQVLRYASDAAAIAASEIPAALVQTPKSLHDFKRSEGLQRKDYRLDELNEPPPRIPGIRSILPLADGSSLLTGGTDCKIRFWDRLRPERCYCICGPSMKTSATMDSYRYDTRPIAGIPVVQEICIRQGNKQPKSCFGVAATDTVGCHRDSVLSLASVQTTQHLLISSCRDGAIKVWK